jgi:hypothetical protein
MVTTERTSEHHDRERRDEAIHAKGAMR